MLDAAGNELAAGDTVWITTHRYNEHHKLRKASIVRFTDKKVEVLVEWGGARIYKMLRYPDSMVKHVDI